MLPWSVLLLGAYLFRQSRVSLVRQCMYVPGRSLATARAFARQGLHSTAWPVLVHCVSQRSFRYISTACGGAGADSADTCVSTHLEVLASVGVAGTMLHTAWRAL